MVELRSPNGLQGNEAREVAIPHLIQEYGDKLHSLALRFCDDPQDADDLVQETFLQAYRKWEQFEGRAKVSTWLYIIASRLCQRMQRKKSGEPGRLESLEDLLPFGNPRMGVVPDDIDVLDVAIRKEARERMERAIAELETKFRLPLVLKEIAGLSIEEIAQILDIKPATVKTRLHRARLRIRHALEAALPQREVPQPIFSKRICLDLLNAKQETLDQGEPFEFPDQVVCDRCEELFATMDLGQSICREIAGGEMPCKLREEVLAHVAASR